MCCCVHLCAFRLPRMLLLELCLTTLPLCLLRAPLHPSTVLRSPTRCWCSTKVYCIEFLFSFSCSFSFFFFFFIFFSDKLLLAQANTNAAMFLTSKVWVDNWKANFTFVLGAAAQHNGGFTFIIQADNIGSAGPNDAGLGYGSYTGGVGGVGYSKSLALEFDTFYDLGVDDTLAGVNCSAPHFAIHSMGSSANSAIEDQGNFAKLCFTQVYMIILGIFFFS